MKLAATAKGIGTSLFVTFVLVFVLVLGACQGSSTGSGKSDPAPQPAARSEAPGAEREGSIAPPDAGGIIVDMGGVRQSGTTLGYQDSTSVWIPKGFAGAVSQIQLSVAAPGGPIQQSNLDSVSVVFGNGAGFKVATGNPANWQCRANANVGWNTCVIQSADAAPTLPSLFNLGASGATIYRPNGQGVAIGSTVTLAIQ